MAVVAIIAKIMPDSPSADIKLIEETAKRRLEEEGALNVSFEERPIAFGLKAIFFKFAWNESKDTSIIENALSSIAHVSSATIEDYRRAFG